MSVPHYWLGMVLVIVFSVILGWLPAIGAGPGGSGAWRWDCEHLRYLILPAITTVGDPDGHHHPHGARARRRHPGQEFVDGAARQGPARRARVFLHVVKNAAPTALAVMGLQLGYLLGGSILIETVFSWPGTGFLLNTAIFQRDLPLLQGTILVLAMFFVALNLIVDIAADRARSAHPAGMSAMSIDGRCASIADAALQDAPATGPGVGGGRLLRDKVALACALDAARDRTGGDLRAVSSRPPIPIEGSMLRRLRRSAPPGYPLGTDELGRDMLSRLIYRRPAVADDGHLAGASCASCIGSLLGIVAGYRRRPGQYRDHAHGRRLLRVPVGAARDRDLRRARRRASSTRSSR